jgi:thiol-disulfide isomerase/thioredoxin
MQGWVWNPQKAKNGNISIGYGLLAPTGRDNVTNNIVTAPGATPVNTVVDYSIQPGQGGWGMVFQWQAFKYLGNGFLAYTDGDYIATQGGTNGVLRSVAALSQPLTAYNAIQDQYLIEFGVSHPISKIPGLTVTFGPRDEGVPARDLFGNDLGFRRPGLAVSVEPGIIYTRGNNMIQAQVAKPFFRDRTKSVPDDILGTHGDAAFANWVWLVSYTLRLPKKDRVTESSLRPAASPVAVPAVAPATPSVVPPATAAAAAPAPVQTSANAPMASKFKSFNLKTLSGARRDLHDYADKVTLVSFFFPRCPYCNVELPEVQKIYDKYKDKGLSMVWINILPDEEHLIRDWQAQHHYTVPVLIGGSEAALEKDYRVTGTPTTYVLNEKGGVLFYKSGYDPGDEKNLEAFVVKALNISPDSAGPAVVSRNDSTAAAH